MSRQMIGIWLLLSGCPSTDGDENEATETRSETSSDDATSADGSGETGVDSCVYPADACDVGLPICEATEFGTPGCGPQEIRGEGHKCIVEALRNNVGGSVFMLLAHQEPLDGPTCGYNEGIIILGDGSAVVSRIGHGGSPVIIEGRRVEIRPPEFFDACVGSDDLATIQACLTDWFVPDSCVPGVCCPGASEAGHPPCE